MVLLREFFFGGVHANEPMQSKSEPIQLVEVTTQQFCIIQGVRYWWEEGYAPGNEKDPQTLKRFGSAEVGMTFPRNEVEGKRT